MTATPSNALRLAEAIPVTGENYRTVAELLAELRELASSVAEHTALVLGITEQARLRGVTVEPAPTTHQQRANIRARIGIGR